MFSAQKIQSGYGNKTVLEDISFSFSSGEVVCILGPNGVGKSTLFKSIMGLKKYEGQVVIDGKLLCKYTRKELAKKVAYVPQSCQMPFDYLVKDIVVAGRYAYSSGPGIPKVADYRAVQRVLKEMGIEDLKNRHINQLSGGEQQMVMIARALIQEPKLLLLDEPSASLDFGNTHKVIQKIRDLANRGIGILMTTHSPKIASMCADYILMIKDKKVYKFGEVEEVMCNEDLIHLYDLENDEALELCNSL